MSQQLSEAEKLHQYGLEMWSNLPGDRNNVEAFSKQNRKELLTAAGYLSRALQLSNKPEPVILGDLAMIMFDLLDVSKSLEYAKQSLKINPNVFSAAYVVFIISWNDYAQRKGTTPNPRPDKLRLTGSDASVYNFSYKLFYGLGKRAAMAVSGIQDEVIKNAGNMITSFNVTMDTPGTKYSQALFMSSTLVSCGELMEEVGLSGQNMFKAVVDQFSGLNLNIEDELDKLILDVLNLAQSQLKTR